MAKRTEPDAPTPIPTKELLRTMKALVLEKLFGWERVLDQTAGDWRWRENPESPWLDWDGLPKIFENLPLCHDMAVHVVARLHLEQKRLTTMAIVFNPGLQGGPWGCRLTDIEKGKEAVKASVVASNQTLAIVGALLSYHGLAPATYHRIYFPHLELGNAGKDSVSRDTPANGGAIMLGRPPGNGDGR